MRQHRLQGWILLEAVLAMACVAMVISATQYQLNQLTKQIIELQAKHHHNVQNALFEQMSKTFGQSPSIDSTISAAPLCQVCRGTQLQRVLQYELSKW
ncbi:hypothetical protein [Marinomonas fungiae]|uniref:hypothetical protein n=1 Tax=Marinomonas fungiae TaxID=1137284 RepID=UPI003A910122